MTGTRAAALVVAAVVTACAAIRSPPANTPSALWEIVSRCVGREHAGYYCTCPAFALSCCGEPKTPDADVVWARAADFVAIRDLKMCHCPPDFVAGLALPRFRVSGIEDPRRPDGIWPFAWDVARTRIADEREIGLVINPADARSQNLMHVHLLRLRPEARQWLDGKAPRPFGVQLVALANLDAVFAATLARVGASQMRDTGVLIARGRDGGWQAAITDRASPQAFTVNRCGPL
jgi:CDP-diacylglycerol pyrophosphatase